MKKYVKKMQLKFPWFLSIECELVPLEIREQLEEICLSAEFAHTIKVKCMHTRELLPPVRSLPNVEIKFASSQEDVYDAVFLNLQAHNRDTSIAESVIEHHAFINNFDKEFCCIVLVNGKTVSTTVTVILDKYIYVPLVATCPNHRKRGYGEIALRASIERALKTLACAQYDIILHATEMGRSMYSRIGFKEISNLDFYIYKSSISN